METLGTVIFNNVSLRDLDAVVQHPPEYPIPERDYTYTHVNGRNGDIITDVRSWKNVDITYDVGIDGRKYGLMVTATKLSQWLNEPIGYARLEDSYQPDFFRLASYKGSGSIKNLYNKAGTIDITFNCKPQKYYKSGEKCIRFLDKDTDYHLINPSVFSANPLIIVYGSGSGVLQINDYSVEFQDILGGMSVDFERQNAWYNDINLNNRILCDYFPPLVKGNNKIRFSNGINSIDIYPRWWTL